MSFTDMLVFKCLMFGLSCLLTLPQLYQTTLITLTFVSVARGAVVFELQQRRPPYVVLGVAFVLMFLLPFILPLLLIGGCLFAPLLERVRRRCRPRPSVVVWISRTKKRGLGFGICRLENHRRTPSRRGKVTGPADRPTAD
jgi:hypothetical protein